jgi:hypothetical protein
VRISLSQISIQAYPLEGLSVGVQLGIISRAITELLACGLKEGTGKVVIAERVEISQALAVDSFC